MRLLFTLIALLLTLFTLSCKDEWKQVKHDNAVNNGITLTEERPQEHLTPKGVRVYWNGQVSAKQKEVIDNGITAMLASCQRDTNQWTPNDAWRGFKKWTKHTDFGVILIKASHRSESPETAGCPLMTVGVWGNYTSTCGTISAVTFKNGRPYQSGNYLIVPYQDDDREVCWTLAENCIKHEGEHEWMLNDDGLFVSYANDSVPPNGVGHPYCVGIK